MKTHDQLVYASDELKNLLVETESDVKYNREFERINHENFHAEIQNITERIKYQKDVNIHIVNDMKDLKSQI